MKKILDALHPRGKPRGFYVPINNGSWRHNYTINQVYGITDGQLVYRVQIGERRRDFRRNGSVYEPLDGLPGTLNSSRTIYTDANGTKYHFSYGGGLWLGEFLDRLGSRIVFPDGREETLHYYVKRYTYASTYGGAYFDVPQLRSVISNNSYQLKLEYHQNNPGIGASLYPKKVTALNSAVEYCNPISETCTLTGDWPKLDFGTSIVDNLGRSTTLSRSSTSISVQRPGETQPGVVAQLDGNFRVSNLTIDGTYTRNYTWTQSGNSLTSVPNDALGRQQTTVVDTSQNVVTSSTNAVGNTTTYAYDGDGRLTQMTVPEGQKVQYAYDTRGNVTSTTKVAESGSGQPNIVTSATYSSSCSNLTTCNKPTSVTDANGNTTNYTYDPNHGGVTKIQAPADSSGTRPTTNVTYSSVTAKTRNSSGNLVNQSTSIMRPSKVTQCATAAACAGSANEQVTEFAYNSTTTPNAHATSMTTRAGNNSVSSTIKMTHTDLGLVETVDGPAAGAVDTTTFRYDAAGRRTGVIGPDPDGSGSLPRIAQRNTYDDFDNVTVSETGTVTGTTEAAWNAFSTTEKHVAKLDSYGRAESVAHVATNGTTQYSVAQFSYDNAFRLECVARRMNEPSTTTSLPSDACTPMAPGSFGSDRISKRIYDTADRVVRTQSGVGTPLVQDTTEVSFNPNGTVAWVEDARNNRTTYTYDGHDRIVQIAGGSTYVKRKLEALSRYQISVPSEGLHR